MKVNKILVLCSAALVFTACASTEKQSNNKKDKNPPAVEAPVENTEKTLSPAQKFIAQMEEINLKFTSSPRETEKGKAFPSPYIVKVTDNNGAPVSDFSVTFSYPGSKKGKDLVYETQVVTTDSNGTASITLPAPSISANSHVTAYPTPISKSEKVVSAAKDKADKAIWKVKSDVIGQGIILFIWEHDEKGKPTNNAYSVLSELQKNGAKKVGNAPYNETNLIGQDPAAIAAKNSAVVGNEFRYMIGGTYKYTGPITKVETGYSCTMVAEIYAIDMKTGEEIYRKTFEQTSVDAKWAQVSKLCKDALGKAIVNDLMYNL